MTAMFFLITLNLMVDMILRAETGGRMRFLSMGSEPESKVWTHYCCLLDLPFPLGSTSTNPSGDSPSLIERLLKI